VDVPNVSSSGEYNLQVVLNGIASQNYTSGIRGCCLATTSVETNILGRDLVEE
jgi:hypothetical protein